MASVEASPIQHAVSIVSTPRQLVRTESNVEREGMLASLSQIKPRLSEEDFGFFRDMLTGIVATSCNGARLKDPEKSAREWKVPTRELTRLVRILNSLNSRERGTALQLLSDSETYGIQIGRDALAIDIYTYFSVLHGTRSTFRK